MPDESIKKRLSRAKLSLARKLRDQGFEVIVSDNRPVCLVAYNDESVRIVRISLDGIHPEDRKLLSKCRSSPLVSREILSHHFRTERFETHKL